MINIGNMFVAQLTLYSAVCLIWILAGFYPYWKIWDSSKKV